jgi:hypothetical protein
MRTQPYDNKSTLAYALGVAVERESDPKIKSQLEDLETLVCDATEVNILDADTISSNWCVEDVQEIASDLTVEQCREVLNLAERKHDANIGINWEVLEYWAYEVRERTV